MDQAKRQHIEAQIAELQAKAAQRPGQQDAMGMVGFAATVLAAQMQALLLAADREEAQTKEDEGK